MSRRVISVEDKKRLVRAHLSQQDYQLLADQLGIKRTTARKIVSNAMKQEDPTNFISNPRGGAHHVKVDEEMREAIANIIGRNPAATLRTINEELQRELPDKPVVSYKYLSTICKGMFFTLKKLEAAPADRNKTEVKQARKEYARWFIEVAFLSPRVIYIDESGYNVWTQRTRGRAIVGERAVRIVNSQRGRNVTLILAISAQRGIEYFSFHVGGTTAVVFQTFFSALSQTIGVDNDAIFVLDNAPCHRSATSLSPRHIIKFLPAYSPMLTPIENAFSCWKWSIKNRLAQPENQTLFSDQNEARGHGMNLSQWRQHLLLSFGESALSAITQEKCANWQTHCTTYFGKCMAMEDIFC